MKIKLIQKYREAVADCVYKHKSFKESLQSNGISNSLPQLNINDCNSLTDNQLNTLVETIIVLRSSANNMQEAKKIFIKYYQKTIDSLKWRYCNCEKEEEQQQTEREIFDISSVTDQALIQEVRRRGIKAKDKDSETFYKVIEL